MSHPSGMCDWMMVNWLPQLDQVLKCETLFENSKSTVHTCSVQTLLQYNCLQASTVVLRSSFVP